MVEKLKGGVLSMVQFIMSLVIFTLFLGCTSNDTSDNLSNTIISNPSQIAPQPLLYHDDANISQLQSGYGTFGAYEVATKSIPNRFYDYNDDYKALHLQTTLFYPKTLDTPRPTLFFYSGYGAYSADSYKALLYFVASKGYNIIFITCPLVQLSNLPDATRDAITRFSNHIDKSKVGFIGHSMGAGVAFWMINELPELGEQARILFPMATGYTVFNDTRLIPAQKSLQFPDNTQMIQQIYAKDYSTDVRIGFDLFLNSDITPKRLMFVYGDAFHTADHGTAMNKAGYHYDALMQRTIFRPLEALMDAAFAENSQALSIMIKESQEDPYFHPYIGTTPLQDIDTNYIHPITSYPFNCYEGGTVASVRKAYCEALGL